MTVSNEISQSDWSAYTILIVEDDLINFRLLNDLLKRTRINILRAVTGIEAVEACRIRKDINLVVMDIQLPEMNGYEATRIIKQNRPELPVIIVTANIYDDERIKTDKCIFDSFISKPFNLNYIIKTLKGFLPGS